MMEKLSHALAIPIRDMFPEHNISENALINTNPNEFRESVFRQHKDNIITAIVNVDPANWDALEEMVLPICKHLTTKEDK